MKDDTRKHGPILNTGNRVNHFRNTFEPISNNYFNKLMNLYKPFSNRVVRDKTGFSLQYHKMNYYELPLCYSKRKIYSKLFCDCGWVMEIKSKSKHLWRNLRISY